MIWLEEKDKLVRFTVRLNEEENTKLTLLANKKGISKAELIRVIIRTLYDEVDGQIELNEQLIKSFEKLSFQLQKFGVVLNQCNRMYFQNTNEKAKFIEEELEKLWECIKVLRE